MREVKYEMELAKKRVHLLKGRRINFRINKGRNKIINFEGCISAVYPAIFTITSDDASYSMSYSDVLTGAVKFFPLKNTDE